MHPEKIDHLKEMGFSQKAITLVDHRVNIGRLSHPTGYAKLQSADGDVMELYLDVESGVIQDARYLLSGYAGLIVSASALTEMVKGMETTEAQEIDIPDIVEYLGGLPSPQYDCAKLARDTLRQALKHVSYSEMQNC